MRKFYRFLRVLSAVTLFFFTWTFLPLWQVAAFAAEKPQSRKTDPSQSPLGKGGSRGVEPTSGERFEKALEAIREDIDKAESKAARNQDSSAEITKVKARRAEIESIDLELRNEFAATEKKLKAAKLPQEILDRHYKFVKHYEDNLKELKTNLDAVGQYTADSKQGKDAIRKAKQHLEKTKTPSKHVPLDPNKLPHRMVKGKERAPRLKKEEFEKDFPRQKKPAGLRSAEFGVRNAVAAGFSLREKIQQKRILLAYNSTIASDMPLELHLPLGESGGSVPQWFNRGMRGGLDTPHWDTTLPDFVFSDSNPQSEIRNSQLILAQATVNLPTADDLAETPEVQFTPEIQAKAAELGHNPVKIYEWVRNNFEYVPTYGSIQGADMCLRSKNCNDIDTASLLVALLRASGISTRYVYGTIEIPIAKAMNWVGGVTDPKMVGTILTTNGIPAKVLVSGGTIKAVQLEHMWVETFVPYGNYRGSMRDDSIKMWIPLDPSFKQYLYKRGMDLYGAMGINGEQYILDYIGDSSLYPFPEELMSQFSNYVTSPFQYYSKRFFDIIAAVPSLTTADIIGSENIALTKAIVTKEYPYLLGSLSYSVIAQGGVYPAIPDNLRNRISFAVNGDVTYGSDLSYSTGIPEIAGKRVTLSYIPASSTEETLVTQYGGLLNVPPYLLKVKPVLMVNGVTVALGQPIGLGYEQTFRISYITPGQGQDDILNNVTAGNYSAIALQCDKTPAEIAGENTQTLIKNANSPALDDFLGQLLYNVGITYFHKLVSDEDLYAKNMQMIITREPAEAMVTSQAKTIWLYGVPYIVSEGGINIDVDRYIKSSFPIDGNNQRTKDFMIASGLGTSSWENMILESFFGVQSVSAAKILKLSAKQNIPIYSINQANISEVLAHLQLNSETVMDIKNAINSGKTVIAPQVNITLNDWTGCGYIVIEPYTGAGAYMISGGLSGGSTTGSPNTGSSEPSIRERAQRAALITASTRRCIVEFALYLLGSIYVRGGESEECGFDCSGLVHYVFTTVYGKTIFPVRLTADGQHERLKNNKWTYPYDERLSGDILWSSGHTGIYYGRDSAGVYNGADLVIHASGRKDNCPTPTDPGWIPASTLPSSCGSQAEINVRICGYYKMVVITAVDSPFFGSHTDEIGRPTPN